MSILSSVNSVGGEFRRDFSWIECVLHLGGKSSIDEESLLKLTSEFETVTILSAKRKPETYNEADIRWISYDPESKTECLADKWNQLLKDAEKEWVLFLDSEESLSFYSIPQKEELTPNTLVPASIQQSDEKSTKIIYQIRLVHSTAENPFEGRNLPDCTRHAIEHEATLFEHPIQLTRNRALIDSISAEGELSVRKITPAAYLLQAERLMEDKKYVQAAAQYRNILKIERLLPFDRLGAVNGLTRCYTEQYKWPKALQLSEKSLEAEPYQRIPYLIQYRIHQLNKQWAKAYDSLKAYYEHLSQPGLASYDSAIDEKETLEQLGELASKAGHKHEAFRYLEEVYKDKQQEKIEDTHLLRKLLMFAIELGKREEAIYYFNEMFGEYLPDNLSDRQRVELDDYMSLFMTNKWYAFAGDLYERLYEAEPDNGEYRRRLIVAFSKTDRIDRARKLIAI
jgi:hypothetical protein